MRKCAKMCLLTNCIVVVVCGIVGFCKEHALYQSKSFLFYTIISNLVAIVMCAVVAVSVAFDKMTKGLWKIHFVVASMMAFTIGVVMLGASIFTNNYWRFFWQNGDWALHLVCPLVVIANHLLFCPKILTLKWGIAPIVITTAYGVVMYTLNAIGWVTGPYFFFDVQTNGIAKSICYGLVIVTYCVAITFGVYIPKRHKIVNRTTYNATTVQL